MSLQEKIDKYGKAPQSQGELSTIGKEIIAGIQELVTELKDDNAKPEKTLQNIKILQEAYAKLPQIFFYNHSQPLLEAILDLSTENIYKAFYDISFDFLKPQIQGFHIKHSDDLVLFMLVHYLEKIPPKELLGFLKTYNEKKQKNPQLKLLIIELFHYVLLTIDKKELYVNDILPALLKTLNPSLAKYIKYKAKVDNNQYVETPKHIVQYLLNYENWAKSLLQKIMKSLVTIINPQKGERRLLLIDDIYETNAANSNLKKRTPPNERLITHYCVLFILDIFEGLIDCRGNAYFLKENVDAFIENVVKTLSEIHHNLQDYVTNYINQTKIKNLDAQIQMFNKKDEYNLPIGKYDKLTLYNPASVAYLAVRVMHIPKESALFTVESKLQLLIPCLYPIFAETLMKHELKSDLLVTLAQLLQALVAKDIGPISNLNKFGVSLDKVIERVSDHAGSTTNEKDKAQGFEILTNVKKLLSERAFASLLVSALLVSKTHALYVYFTTEYKIGITNALKQCGSVGELQEIANPFLNASNFRKLMEVGVDSGSGKFKDNSDLISSCVNILMMVYMKLSNLLKNNQNYVSLQFKDPSNLYNPTNFRPLLEFGEKSQALSGKINDDIKMYKSQLEQLAQENPENMALEGHQMKLNEFYMISDNIQRIGELYQEFKSIPGLMK